MPARDLLTPGTGHRKAGAGAALLFALLVVAGCSGIEPYEVRNHREEGPEQGVFTGSEGEFVIFTHGEAPKGEDEPESDDESGWRDLDGGEPKQP